MPTVGHDPTPPERSARSNNWRTLGIVIVTSLLVAGAMFGSQEIAAAYKDRQNFESAVACEKLNGDLTQRYNCILSDGLIVEPIKYLGEYGEDGGLIRRDTTNVKEAEDE